MKRISNSICIIAMLASVFVASCTKEEGSENEKGKKVENVLNASLDTIKVAAASEEGELEVKVTVTSNLYWSATVKDAENDWAYISGSKSFTPADEKTAEEQTLKLKFENNTSYFDDRTATLVIAGAADTLSIPIVQEKKPNTNYVRTSSQTSYTGIVYRGAIIEIPIEANVPWKAAYEEGSAENHWIMVGDSTAHSVLANAGDTLKLKIRKNTAIEKVKATLKVTDMDGLCTPLVFTFEQDACPAVQMDTTSTRFCNYSAYGQTKSVVFNAALDWTATISGGEAKIEGSASGAKNETASVVVSFPENTTTADRKATLTVKASNNDQFVLEITQNRKADYKMEFRPYPDKYSKDGSLRTWRGASPSTDPVDGFEYYGLFIEKNVTNAFGYYTLYEKCTSVCADRIKIGFLKYDDNDTAGNLGYNETGFMIGVNGDNKGGFVEFPAIPGKKLARVEVLGSGQTDNQAFRARMQDLDGNVLEGTREVKILKNTYSISKAAIPDIRTELDASPDSYYCWAPTNTQPNTAYRLRLSTRAMVRWINFYYE